MIRAIMLALLFLGSAAHAAPAMRVHLLGTGGPEMTQDRQGYATLVEVPGAADPQALLLFDAGHGVMQQLYLQRINPKRVTRIFLTHLHSDHIAGLADLWITPWFLLGRAAPLEIWGPPGTAAMVAGMRAMYGHDVAGRTNAFNPASAIAVTVHEIAPGTIYTAGDVRVEAFAVEHADGDPAFGFRVVRQGHVVALSGDTTLTDSLIKAATGADLLVQNIIAFSPRLSAMPEMQGVLAKLTTPEQAATLLKAAKPRLTIFSHIVKKELPGAAGDAAVIARVRAAGYSGPLAMGHDREIVEVGDAVRLLPPPSLKGLRELDSKTAEP
jgi:ribonuclease Z